MEGNNKISIIVPINNTSKYLTKCIESLTNQTYQNIEIILIDDGSTDNSYDICKYYHEMDPRVVITKQEHRGVSEARNTGFRIATGNFIGFIDSDDYIMPNMFEKLLKEMIKYNADVAECSIINKFVDQVDFDYTRNEFQILRKNEILENFLLKKIQPSCCNKLFKKTLLNNLTFFNVSKVEDHLYCWQSLKKAKKMILIPDKLYVYNWLREGSLTSKFFNEKSMLFYELHLFVKTQVDLYYPDLSSEAVYYLYASCLNLVRNYYFTITNCLDMENNFTHYIKKILLTINNLKKEESFDESWLEL